MSTTDSIGTEIVIELDRGGESLVQSNGFGAQPFGTSPFGVGSYEERQTKIALRSKDFEQFNYKRRVSALADFRLDLPGDYSGWEGAEIIVWSATSLAGELPGGTPGDLGIDYGEAGYGDGTYGGVVPPESDEEGVGTVIEVGGERYRRDELRFHGRVDAYDYGTDSHITTLGGPGIGYELSNEEIEIDFVHLPAWEALSTYLYDFAPFEGEVYDREPEVVYEDATVQEVDAVRNDLEQATDITETDPIIIRSGALQLAQASWATDMDGSNYEEGAGELVESEEFSGGSAVRLSEPGDFVQVEIDPDYSIPQLRVGVRATSSESPAIQVTIDGDPMDTIIEEEESLDLQWFDAREFGETAQDIDSPTEIRIEAIGGLAGYGSGAPPGYADIDVVAPYDVRYEFSFPNELDENGALSGPEPLPHAARLEGQRAETEWNVSAASLTTEWDHEPEAGNIAEEMPINQSIELSNDDIRWNVKEGATETYVDFTDTFGYGVRAGFTLARYGSSDEETPTTPTTGTKSVRLSGWEMRADTNDLAVIENKTLTGNHLKNIEELVDIAGMDFYIPHDLNDRRVVAFHAGQLTREFPAFDPGDIEELNSSKSLTDYANRVIVKGKEDAETGERILGIAEDSEGIEEYGVELYTSILPEADTRAAVQSAARRVLEERVSAAEFDGSIDGARLSLVDLTDIDPGVSYQIPQWQRYVSLESYSVTWDDSATVDFDFAGIGGLAGYILGTQTGIEELERAL